MVEWRSKDLLEGPGWVNKSTWLGEQTSGKLKEEFQYFSYRRIVILFIEMQFVPSQIVANKQDVCCCLETVFCRKPVVFL
jgi:hypothetical protein